MARRLRRAATPAERHAWRLLRNRGLFGLTFRRQHPVTGFIVDFYCAELRLAIEIDGGYHHTPEQHGRDAERETALAAGGIRILRIPNSQVTEARLRNLLLPHVPPLRICGEGDRG